MALRTFMALDIDERVRREMVRAQQMLVGWGATFRPVSFENLHVTLQFLGDVADEAMAKVCDTAAEVAAMTEPFDFEVDGLVAVPPRGQLRMVWAGIRDDGGKLAKLQADLAAALAGLGLRGEERQYRPHVTLGRVKFADNPARFRQRASELTGLDFGVQLADQLVVYTSELTGDGPVYTPAAKAPLGL
jgi:2'-5' RNA ligase